MPASQAGRRRFESGRPLQFSEGVAVKRRGPLVASGARQVRAAPDGRRSSRPAGARRPRRLHRCRAEPAAPGEPVDQGQIERPEDRDEIGSGATPHRPDGEGKVEPAPAPHAEPAPETPAGREAGGGGGGTWGRGGGSGTCGGGGAGHRGGRGSGGGAAGGGRGGGARAGPAPPRSRRRAAGAGGRGPRRARSRGAAPGASPGAG